MPIKTGTASWADKNLIACGRFYPRGCNTAEARLRYYATQFPLVEVDASYYAMPSAQNSQLWVERTPDDFVMNMKAFRLFTGHPALLSALPEDIYRVLPPTAKLNVFYRDIPPSIRDELWRRFTDALRPLKASNKLGAVVFQFAPWILNNSAGRAHVEHCADRMAGHTVAVEFRNRSWFQDAKKTADTLAFERDRGLVNIIVDEPQGFENSIPAVWEVTNPRLAIVRLHGRNTATWDYRGNSSGGRFDYEYADDELASLSVDIRKIAGLADEVHTVLNTNKEDQGQRNAQRLIWQLREMP
ncbi:MAG TPA: DUF72 domain-containing protein [Rhodocyclaceae bacterium]|nr:DUF72 domain-containing protein [Rhodocyclaceae bacterium]